MDISHHDLEHLGLPQHPAAPQALAHGLVRLQYEAQSNPAGRHKAFNAGRRHHGALAVSQIHNQTCYFDTSTVKAACLRQSPTDYVVASRIWGTWLCRVGTQSYTALSHSTWTQMLDAIHSHSAHANPMSEISWIMYLTITIGSTFFLH